MKVEFRRSIEHRASSVQISQKDQKRQLQKVQRENDVIKIGNNHFQIFGNT